LILTGTPADKHAKLQVLPAIKPLDVEELACPLERNGDFLSKLTWPDACVWCRMHGIPKRFVYILRSRVDLSRHYVGITNDLAARLEWHNHGPCGHTVSHRP
jgi:Predicted endonuclease containing a URI domain